MKRRFFFLDPWHYDVLDALMAAMLLAMLGVAWKASGMVAFNLFGLLGAAFLLGQKRARVRFAREKGRDPE